jgi:glycosyltransferase involved in cell wall biosynthesis
MDNGRAIHHFGPDPEYVGGMGSVIRVLTERQMGGGSVVSHPTRRPDARLASLPLALRAALRIPRLRGIDVVHVHLSEDGAFVREGAIVVLSRLLAKATIVTMHGASFLPFARRHRRLASFVLRRANVITCLDEEVCGVVRELAPKAKAQVLFNPVVMDDDSGGADETEEIVLFAGEIGLRKGADTLCRAWEIVATERPGARCIVVGPSGDFEAPSLAGLDVRPSVDSKAMRELLRHARVVALPSRAEGMPMFLTEAMGAGRPFVSTPVGGIPDLAREGGVLVDVGDHVGLARALTEFLMDPALARSTGERGRAFCRETRSVEVIDAQLTALYTAAGARGST